MGESTISAVLSFLRRLLPLLAVAIFFGAIYFVHKMLKPYSYREIMNYVEAIPPARLLASLAATVCSYAFLTGYDLLGVRYAEKRVPAGQVVFASSLAFAFSNTIGLANLAGTSVRLRLYPYFGLLARDVLKMVGFISLSFWLGFFALAGAALTIDPVELPTEFGLPPGILRVLGIGLLALVGAYLTFAAIRKEPIRVAGRHFRFPSLRLALLQVVVAAGDWALAGAALFFLLPPSPALGYFHFLSIYLTAQLAALLSHVPAGAGVLEALITRFVGPEHHATPAIVGGLIAFRLIYYLAPLVLATAALGVFEVYRGRDRFRTVSRTAFRWTSQLAPPVAAVLVFLSGAILLFSGASPAERDRLEILRHRIPLVAMEFSHFAGSVVGMVLLVLARGLLSRSRPAWGVTVVLLGMGAVFSLVKGLDYEEALLLIFFAGFLFAAKHEFYRQAPLFAEPLSRSWVISSLIVVSFAVWLGFFTNKHVEYDADLWWRFTFHGDASRFLRMMVGMGAAAGALALMRLLSPAGAPRDLPAAPLARIKPLVEASPDTMANLALVGDKQIFLNEAGDAFLMYAVQGSTWAALGDPVGNPDSFSDLLYEFKRAADGYGGAPAFYQVRADHLPLYIDLGMNFLKLGEEALVSLKEFSLDGKGRKGLRYYYNRSLKSNPLTFAIEPPERFEAILPELREISDQWLAGKGIREKGYSLGYFDPAYLRNFPTAVLRDAGGRIQSFANVWANSAKEELSVDLMRYREPGGTGTMERLMIDLMLWGKAEGYAWFNLGMAPLSGLAPGRFRTLWNRAGRLLYQHGERFYNFQGLRAYKEKFDPDWEPRYLAYSGKLRLPKVLADLAVIIAGGVKGVVGK